MKTDQEPSILALKRAIAAERVGETVPLESPVRASKSNGMMENAAKLWQEHLRTIKHDVESVFKKKIEVDSVLFSWLVPYVADTPNKYKIGVDGVTAYERTVDTSADMLCLVLPRLSGSFVRPRTATNTKPIHVLALE